MKLSPKRPRSLLLLQEVALIFFASDNIIDIVMQEMSCQSEHYFTVNKDIFHNKTGLRYVFVF